jgi:hypothetical protein
MKAIKAKAGMPILLITSLATIIARILAYLTKSTVKFPIR